MRFDLVTGVLMRDDATLVHGENEWDGIVRMIAGVFAQAGDTLHDARSLANEMLEARAKAELHARLEEEQDAP
jgi:predicted RNase H-like HicB family nuclease